MNANEDSYESLSLNERFREAERAQAQNGKIDVSVVLKKGDARDLDWIADGSCHLAVTSPPYWTLKRYNDTDG